MLMEANSESSSQAASLRRSLVDQQPFTQANMLGNVCVKCETRAAVTESEGCRGSY